jgi:hypothetical protein
MKQKRKLRPLTYFYAHGFEVRTFPKHTVWKGARRAAAEPGAAERPEAGRKVRARHEAEACEI